MNTKIDLTTEKIVSKESITHLPQPVQSWLLQSGIIGNEIINYVFLEQKLQMLMSSNQKKWHKAAAHQHFSIEPPAFDWKVDLKINPFVKIFGNDRFVNGKGKMSIKLFGIIPVVNAKNNDKIDQATLQRYLAEIVWFPWAALHPGISWEPINDHSAKACFSYKETTGEGVFHFDETGIFERFEAMRYKDSKKDSPLKKWTVRALKTEKRNEIIIPVELEVDWELEGANWTWLKLTVTKIEYHANNPGF